MIVEAAMGKLWQANIIKITKEMCSLINRINKGERQKTPRTQIAENEWKRNSNEFVKSKREILVCHAKSYYRAETKKRTISSMQIISLERN